MSNSIRAHEEHRLREIQMRKEHRMKKNANRNDFRSTGLHPLHLTVKSEPPPTAPVRKLSSWQKMTQYLKKMTGR